MRLLVPAALLVVSLAPAVQAQAAAADTSLAAFVGLWVVEVSETPIGVVTGVLVVHEDGTGALSLVEMAVADAPVAGLRVSAGALVGDVPEMFSPVAGQSFTASLRLTPGETGALEGVIDAGRGEAYRLTARRPAE